MMMSRMTGVLLGMMMGRVDLEDSGPRLGQSGGGGFPWSGNSGTGTRAGLLVPATNFSTRTDSVRGHRRRATTDHYNVSVIVVVVVAGVVVVVVVCTVVVIVRRACRAGSRTSTATSTATDTTTAHAVDHHLVVYRSDGLGSTRRCRDTTADHHHRARSPIRKPSLALLVYYIFWSNVRQLKKKF